MAGGGPSLIHALPRLKAHAQGLGEIWGINRTAQWLCERGIPATFFTVDPQYVPGMTNVDRAIIATCAHPQIFGELEGKDVSLFHIHHMEGRDEFVADGGPSSVCRAVPLAVHMGYSSVTFYGCEGSYDGASHAYNSPLRPDHIVIRAGGRDYRTQPDYQMQCEYLAAFLKSAPEYFSEESGGLLRAMLYDPDWEHVAFSTAVMDRVYPGGWTAQKYEVADAR